MKISPTIAAAFFTTSLFAAPQLRADDWQMTIGVNRPGALISPLLYGLMTEEINHAYDGGLYAELIRNRSFKDDANAPAHWSLLSDGGDSAMSLDKSGGINEAQPFSLKVQAQGGNGRVGVANEGFWGVPVQPNTTYKVSFFAKGDAMFRGPLTASLESNDGASTWASASVQPISTEWKQYALTLRTGKITPSQTNKFVISTPARGAFWLSFVSVFPPTYKNRPNGNRIDLMQKLAAMNPAFLRFPGGNYVDPGHYQWKKTLGPVETRPGSPGAWGYRASEGLGLLEFFLWCEDLKMEPVLAVTVGRGWLAGNADVTPLVQDALDEIEYVTGSVNTEWGAKRAADGHAAPFPLRYVEIGNEDFFDPREVYDARFTKFYDAIRAKYPQLKLIATRHDVTRRPDLVDDHLYANVPAMLRASHNYDNYDRSKPKIFVGEWASQDKDEPWNAKTVRDASPTPSLYAALGDAVYLTSLERNSDVVEISCYAPLFVNVNPGARQWAQNLIGYDALTSFGSPSYYMQAMFGNNSGDVVLPVEIQAAKAATAKAPHGAFGVGTWLTQAEFQDAQTVQDGKTVSNSWRTQGDGWKSHGGNLVQSGNGQGERAMIGEVNGTDGTFKIRARKTGGAEGFLILLRAQDDKNFTWWNIGGWQNARSAVETTIDGAKEQVGPNSDFKVETGRWYDIRVELQGQKMRGYIDDKLIGDVTLPSQTMQNSLFATASRDNKNGDIILKVVNMEDTPQTLNLNFAGAPRIRKTARGEVLTGQLSDINTVAQPTKVAPRLVEIRRAAPKFAAEIPPHSVSVLRFQTR